MSQVHSKFTVIPHCEGIDGKHQTYTASCEPYTIRREILAAGYGSTCLVIVCSTLITKVRKAKTAAEERAIIKQESAYIRTVVGSEHARHAKRNLVKLMYIRMLGYPAEFGQVPCLDLITKGDYSAKVLYHTAFVPYYVLFYGT